jgi:thiol-disulfide isomerase/thioredoxin
MKRFAVFAAACWLAAAQQPPAKPTDPAAAERDELTRAMAPAGNSPLETLRAIDKHLARYPDSAYRPRLEERAFAAAVALGDEEQVIRYGEMVLARQPGDVSALANVTRALLAAGSRPAAERALLYARRTEELVRQMQKGAGPGNISPAEWRDQTDRDLARAMTGDARATGILGRPEEALATAQRAFETYPDARSAREIAWWYERLGKPMEAVRALAGAFSIPDPQTTAAERARDRVHMGELYRQATGSEEGLGAIALEAYDRGVALQRARDARLHQNEPNAGIADPMQFTLSSVDGQKLAMASLKGKVLVLDVWATWCVPCREQHPLYEQVKQRFRDNPAVMFLSITTDSEHQLVQPFLEEMKWQGPVYFEDGLAAAFAVESLPATILLDRRGKLFTRMNGYVKELFVEQLTERIRDALAVPAE